MEDIKNIVEHIIVKKERAKLVLKSLPDKPGIAAEIFTALGREGFNVDLISESSTGRGTTDISFAVDDAEVSNIISFLKKNRSLKVKDVVLGRDMGMITIVGNNLSSVPGIAGKMFSILSENGINIEMISTSISSITILIGEEHIEKVSELLKEAFGLN